MVQLSIFTAITALASTVLAAPTLLARQSLEYEFFVPFGIQAGQPSNVPNNCVGLNGVLIPCTCPPDADAFIQQMTNFVNQGQPFPPDDSFSSQVTRLETQIVTLQNFNGGLGSGNGCPAAATTWNALLAELKVRAGEA